MAQSIPTFWALTYIAAQVEERLANKAARAEDAKKPANQYVPRQNTTAVPASSPIVSNITPSWNVTLDYNV